MKSLRYIMICAMAAIAVVSCTDVDVYIQEPSAAGDSNEVSCGISSSDPSFTEDGGYSVLFKSRGGETVVHVDCPADWFVENTGESWLEAVADSKLGILTLSCEQNYETDTNEAAINIAVGNYDNPTVLSSIRVTQNAFGTPEISAESTLVNIPAIGELTIEIGVETSFDEWNVETSCTWLLVQKGDGVVVFTADANQETGERETDVTLVSDNGTDKATETIRITQDGIAYISLSQGILSFFEDGTSKSATVTIESNFEWEYSYDKSNSWLTITRDGDDLTASVDENTSDDNRTCNVIITSGDGAQNVTEYVLSIAQLGLQSSSMVLVYTITEEGTAAKLPLTGEVDCRVDWGDGTVEEITSTYPTHTYEIVGTYNVSINGSVTELYSRSLSNAENLLLTGVRQWGVLGVTSLDYAFYNCANIESLPADETGAFADLISCQYTFDGCGVKNSDGTYSGLREVSADLFQYATNCTTFYGLFWNCYNLQEIPEGLFRNNTEVTSFGYAFYNCYSITGVPDDLFYNCPLVTNMNYLFSGCSALTNIPAGFFDKNVEVTSFTRAFYDCESLTHIPENLFAYNTKNTSFNATFHGTNIETIPEGIFDNNPLCESYTCTFQECSKLKEIPADLFKYGSKCETIASIFSGCSSLETIPAGLFDEMTASTAISYAFKGTNVKTVPEGLFKNFASATRGVGVFQDCPNLESVPADLFVGLENLTTVEDFFNGCTSLKSIPDGLLDNMTSLTTVKNIFRGCTSLTAIPKGLFAKCEKLATMTYIFYGCTGLTSIDDEAFANLTAVTTYADAFQNCTNLKTIGAKAFYGNTALTTLSNAFSGCENLESIGESAFEGCSVFVTGSSVFAGLEKLKSIGKRAFANCNGASMTVTKMFQNCTALTDVGAELFADCSTLKTVSYLFSGCSALKTVPEDIFKNCTSLGTTTYMFQNSGLTDIPANILENFGTTTSMNYFFQGCTALKTVPEELFANCTKVTSWTYLFDGCTALESVPEGLFKNCSATTNFQYAFRNCSSLTEIPAGLFDATTKVTNFGNTFNGCTGLKECESPYTEIESGGETVRVHLYERTNYSSYFSNPSSHTNSFTSCTGLTDFAAIVAAGWAVE